MENSLKRRILNRYYSEMQSGGKRSHQEEKQIDIQILHSDKGTKNNKFKRTEKEITFKFKQQLDEEVNLLFIREQLEENFQILIDKLKEGEDPNHYMSIEIEHHSLNDTPLYISYKKINEMDPSVIFQRILKYHQSNKKILHGGKILIRAIIVENIKGMGPKGLKKAPKTLKEKSKSKRSVICVKNEDNTCAFRAFFIAKYHKENYHLKNTNDWSKDWQAVKYDKRKLQTNGAIEIMEKCGLEMCDGIGQGEWKIIQEHYPEYQIKVIDGSYKGNFIFRGPENDKRIFIEYADFHYNAIIDIKAYMTHDYYCEKCHVVFSRLFDHRCEDHCKSCYTNCEKDDNIIKCADCNREFFGSNCYNVHLNNKLCTIIKKCSDCGVTYKRQHECQVFRCKKCCEIYTEQPHYCFIANKIKTYLEDEDTINKIIVSYDIESTQVSGEHIPNLLVCKTKCDHCADSDVSTECEYCFIPHYNYNFGKLCVKNFVKYLFVDLAKKAEQSQSMIYAFAHNARGYDAQFVLREVWNLLVTNVDVVMRGRKILVIKCGNVKLLDSLNFFLQPLANLPKALGLDVSVKKGDFPHLFNREENYSYIGQIPDLDYFSLDYMTNKHRAKVEQWHKEYRESGKVWNFMEELGSYCENDVDILMKCVIKFRKVFREITGLDPITRSFTLASIGLEVFKANFLDEKKLAVSPVEGYSAIKNHSTKADIWLDYIQKNQGIKLIREYRIGKYWVDGYDENEKTIYEYLGCFWHGHECIPGNENKHRELETKFQELRNMGYKIIFVWECQFKDQKQNNIFLKNYYNERLVHYDRLKKHGHANIRESFFGGRTNNLQFYHSVDDEEEIKYLDVCSLYPYVLKNRTYPIGHPQIIRENFDYSLQSYFGFIKCKVEPPRGLYLPVLPIVRNDKLLFPLCVTCAENYTQICLCEDRTMVNTWTSEELKLALKKGYKIKQIYEVLHYPESAADDSLFKRYVDMWLKIKQEASGWPGWCQTKEQKQQYISDYEKYEDVKLEYDKVEKNEALRFIAKIMLNSFWGKLAQRPNQNRTEIVNSYDRYFQLIIDKRKVITGELMVNEDTLIVTWEYIEDEFDNVKNYNIAVGSYVTAYARIKLYEIMEEIEMIRPRSLLYHDTDSVMYVRKYTDIKVKCGDYLGELTDEIEKNYGKDARCIKFVSLGPKNYAYIVDLGNGEYITEIKSKGINMTSRAKTIVTFEKMLELATKYSQGVTEQIYVPQMQFTLNQHCQIHTRFFDKVFRAVSEKRVVVGNGSLPYGY